MLTGTRVLDLSRLLPGPFASSYLAGLGADVVQVEDPRGGDPTRHSPPGGPFFDTLNRGKRSLALDVRHPRGREVFLRLAGHADVVLESFRPGVADALGIGYDTVRAINPRIVYCSLTGYGQSGPHRDLAGHDINYISLAGLLGLSGPRTGAPTIPPVPIADLSGGMLAALAIVAALTARARTGEGRYLDAAMSDVLLSWLVLPAALYLTQNQVFGRGEFLLSGGVVCYNVYETADGRHVSLGALEPKFWTAFCRAVGREDLLPYQFAPARGEEPVYVALCTLFAARTRDDWAELGRQADCCLTPVLDVPEALGSAYAHERQMVRHDPATGTAGLGLPPVLGTRALPPAAALGAHSFELLAEAGVPPAEVSSLVAAGVVLGQP